MKTDRRNRLVRTLLHPAFLCAASFLVCFLFALLLLFPLDPFARQLEQLVESEGVQLEIIDPQLLFPLGLGAAELNISHASIPYPVQLQNVDLRPLWLSLFGNNPGVSFDLNTYEGDISGSAYRDGYLKLDFANLEFAESLAPHLPLTLEGNLPKGEFNGKLPLAGKNQGQLKIEMNDLLLKGMQQLGSASDLLAIGQLSLSAEAKGPVVTISRLEVKGPAFDLTGSGSLRVGRIPAQSSLNLTLELTPKDALDPMLKDLLSLMKKPQPDGRYKLSLRGPLSNLRIN